MNHDPVRPEARADIAALRRRLARLAGEIDARFVTAGATLADSVATIDRVVATLDTLIGALDDRSAGAAVHALAECARVLDALPAMQAERLEDIALVRHTTAELGAGLLELQQGMRALSVNGTNLRVVATGAPALADLIEPLFAGFDEGDAQLGALAADFAEVTARFASVQRLARLFAAECAKVAPALPRRLADDARALRARQVAVGESAATVGAIARAVRDRVGVVLRALQIGDITHQRVGHVVAALRLLGLAAPQHVLPHVSEQAEQATVAHLLRLLAAQLADTAAEFEEQTSALLAGLRDLTPDAGRLHTLLAACGAESGGDFLRALEQSIVEVERLTDAVRLANDRSRVLGVALGEAFQRLMHRVDALGVAHAGLQRVAMAIRACGAELGAEGQAAVAIADAIRACVARLDAARAGMIGAVAALERANLGARHRARFETQLTAGAGLGKSLAGIRLACRRIDRGIGDDGLDPRALAEALECAATGLQGELLLGASLREIAEAMHALGGGHGTPVGDADALLRALLPQVAGCYSMTRERDIHRGHLLPGMGRIQAAEVEESDDGLF